MNEDRLTEYCQLPREHTDYLTFDGKSYDVLSCRSEPTALGTAWRFISGERKTLVLVPFQTPKLVTANPGVVPGDVISALSGLASLAFAVLDAYMPQEGTKDYDDVPLGEWVEYARTKFELRNEASEKAALELIQASNLRWNGNNLPSEELRELRDALFDIARRNADNPNCSHDDLRYALTLWKEITGHDPRENILLAYAEPMPAIVEALAKRTAEAEAMPIEEARRLVMQKVHYVAELGMLDDEGRHYDTFVLLQSAQITVYNEDDAALLAKIPLSAWDGVEIGELEEVELKTEAKPSTLTLAQLDAAKNRRKLPKLRTKIVKHYKGLRKERGKEEAARLTLKWMARPEEAGGLGIDPLELPKATRTIKRWAGESD